MKLTLVGPVYPYRGGIAHFTTLLAQNIQECHHQVQVISFRRQYPSWLYPGASDKDPSLEPLRVQANYLLDPLYPWTWERTARQITDFKPDAAIFSWWTTFWGPALWGLAKLLKREKIQVLFLIHNVFPHEPKPWDTWIAKQVLRQGSSYLVQSEEEKKHLQSICQNAAIYLAYHPRYTMFIDNKISKADARRRLGITETAKVALIFGIVRPYKGVQIALEACADLVRKGESLFLIVAGEFWEEKTTYLDRIEQLGISDQVLIEDRYIPNEDVGVFFSAADIYLAPYIHGTQSGALKIAMGFGLPAIVSEPIAHGINREDPRVRIVPAGDVQALSNAIYDLLHELQKGFVSFPLPENRDWENFVRIIENILHQGSKSVREQG